MNSILFHYILASALDRFDYWNLNCLWKHSVLQNWLGVQASFDKLEQPVVGPDEEGEYILSAVAATVAEYFQNHIRYSAEKGQGWIMRKLKKGKREPIVPAVVADVAANADAVTYVN